MTDSDGYPVPCVLFQRRREEQKERQENKLPKTKNEFLVIINDQNKELDGKDLIAYVVQQKEGDDAVGLYCSKPEAHFG